MMDLLEMGLTVLVSEMEVENEHFLKNRKDNYSRSVNLLAVSRIIILNVWVTSIFSALTYRDCFSSFAPFFDLECSRLSRSGVPGGMGGYISLNDLTVFPQ